MSCIAHVHVVYQIMNKERYNKNAYFTWIIKERNILLDTTITTSYNIDSLKVTLSCHKTSEISLAKPNFTLMLMRVSATFTSRNRKDINIKISLTIESFSITPEEVREAVMKLKKNKSSGLDGLHGECFILVSTLHSLLGAAVV